MNPLECIIFLFHFLIFPGFGFYLANKSGRNAIGWSIICFAIGILGIILLLVLPSMKNENMIKRKKIKRENDLLNRIKKLEEQIESKKSGF